MTGSYEDMMGTEQPVVSDHKATQHYAGDVVNFPRNQVTTDFARITAPQSEGVAKTMGSYKQPLGNEKITPLKPEFK